MNWLRKHQRKILGFVIAGFLISTFVGFGLYITSGKSNMDTVAEVNDEKIPFQRFNALYNQAVTMKRNNKEDVTADTLKSMRQEVIQGLIQESVFFQEADRYGFQVSDQELAVNLASYPAFQKDGKFSGQAYVNMLQTVLQTSPKDFEEAQRRQIEINHLRSFIMQGIKITDRELEMEIALRMARDAGKKTPPIDKEKLRQEMAQEKGAHILNRWYQQLGTNVKFKVFLDESGRQG